ncbi:hypothetical protein [Vibrio crassostreae]|uniref:RloB-like protein n=1 Tax=Vibrio crassostreae TaxID=246167 RepID=A0ABM9QWA2_9VIBR|nr:hypothetical protein [Vibrio crassostreae]TCL30685.1 hypothetical protein EDB52_101972 [Vibrio crassostreae]TCT53228.1 hypothetical protein EDB39_101294 [Vibrio crassostreae]TCT64106.1 hypothetical protein EDB40_101606 [Vibrio crassostreae]CAK1834140.1 RloB domain-containing protein [Vibrio crassostreae]CAK1835716.1 RloB domain-containing protein [Vibrio crassostreae]
MAKKKRVLKDTLIFVGEGEAEKAFLLHLKSIYGTGNPKVTPKSAGGKGPNNVIGDALGTLASSGCTRVAALLDTDLKWPVGLTKEAARNKIPLIGSTPCLEGFLLDILGIKKTTTNKGCKQILHPMLDGKETCKMSYSKLFTKDVLDEARQRVEELDKMIKIIQGK